MDGGESEGDSDGITTMKAIHEPPLLQYTSPYGHEESKENREWSDEPSDYYEHLSASPFRPGVYDDVSEEDVDNDTGIGLTYCSPTVSATTEQDMAVAKSDWLCDDGKRPFESPGYELFTEASVRDSEEDELQRSLRESVSRHRLLAMKMPWSPHPQPLPPERRDDEYCDDEELKRSLMESVKRHSMLSRRRSLGLEERERNEAEEEEASSSEEDGSSRCSCLEEEEESKVTAETGDVSGMEGIIEEDCEGSVKTGSGYSGSNVDSNVDGPGDLAAKVSGDVDGDGECGREGTPAREACLLSATTASPDRISRRLRSRSCARASREKHPDRQEYRKDLGRNKPDRKIRGKRTENGPVNNNDGKMRTKKGCRAKKATTGKASSGLVVRAMLKLKRQEKRRKVPRPISLSDQKKKAIRLKLASERKRLLVERRLALERELDTVVDQGLLVRAPRTLNLEGTDGERVASNAKLGDTSCSSSSRGSSSSSHACSSVTLGSSPTETYPLRVAAEDEAIFRDCVGEDQGACRQLKPETLKQLAAKVSQALKEGSQQQPGAVATVADEEEPRTVVSNFGPEMFELERGDDDQDDFGRVAATAYETQRRGPGRRRKRGGKYPVPPKPVRLSRNGKKLGRPRTKNVQEHVEDFVRGATNIMEPLSICLPHFNHHLQCNHEDQNNDGNNCQGLESLAHDQGPVRALQETSEEVAEPEDERRFGCRAPKSTFRCKEIAVRQHDKFTQILLVSTTKQKNALSVQALSELESVLQSARKDAACHVVLLSAPTGNTFCSGVDLQGLVSSDGHAVSHRVACQASDALKAFLKTLVSFPKPVVAAVNGEAVGLGVTLLPLCDVVYASDKATFRTLYGRIGQAPEGGATCTMPDLLGPARASELLLTGRKLTATEAFEQGLVSQVLWPNTFMEQVIPRVRHLASQSVQFAETTKALMRCHQRSRVEMAIEMECRLLASQWQSKECQTNMRNIIQQNELS